MALLHVVGFEALEVYNTFLWDTEGDNVKVDKTMENCMNDSVRARLLRARLQKQDDWKANLKINEHSALCLKWIQVLSVMWYLRGFAKQLV